MRLRMIFVVMTERRCKVMQYRSYIRFGHERVVIFLHRFHEPLSHTMTLRATHRCRTGFQIQLFVLRRWVNPE